MKRNEAEPKREVFGSRFGFIVACIGSAVGMGNIWMFPYRTGPVSYTHLTLPTT